MNAETDGTDIKWLISESHNSRSEHLSRALNISPLVSQVLINRGIDTPERAGVFLSARLRDLHDPFLMKNMEKAVDRIRAALHRREKIVVYGDYDVDGITATAILMLFFRSLSADVHFYIPSRMSEGYGLSADALARLKQQGASLIITVDCGVSDHDAIAYARSRGMDVIVTDHHMTPEHLPEAAAVLNPRQPGCAFPFKGLAGVGVAFNFIMALRKALRERGAWEGSREPNLRGYLDLVALGTVADVVPMVDENRIFVRSGLAVLAENARPGIEALKTISGLGKGELTTSLIAYRLAPRLNAPGRLSDASLSVDLLLSTDSGEAARLAARIDEENTRRQKIERKILSEARGMLSGEGPVPDALVLSSNAWHPGVIGLCASRLCDEYFRPAILIAVNGESGEGRGSARGTDGFNVYEAISGCSEFLQAYGGHSGAAGITVLEDDLQKFSSRFTALVRDSLHSRTAVPTLPIDAEISLKQISTVVMDEIEALAPFGPENPEPVFCTQQIKYYSSMVVGNGHLKMKIRENGQFFDAIGFNMASRYSLEDEEIRLAFVPQFNYFNGSKTIQLNLKAIKAG